MEFKNIDIIHMLVTKKEIESNTIKGYLDINAIINPPAPQRSGEDITEKVNKLYLQHFKIYN